MAQAIADLHNIVEDKDLQIAQLMSKLKPTTIGESIHKCESSSKHAENEKETKKAPPRHDSIQKSNHSTTAIAALSVQQLQEIIASTIKAQYGGSAQNSLAYSKPHTKRTDTLRIPMGYQLPKLQQFDGMGNPNQHITNFIKTCNNANTNGNLLVKQFVRSLKKTAFDWYVDSEPESIDS